MKKTMLWAALFSLISAPIQAETSAQASPAQPQSNNVQLSGGMEQVKPTTQIPSATPPATENLQQNSAAPQAMPTPAAAVVINCDYKIPAQTKTIDQSLILTWSEKATIQAFNFDPNTLDSQIQALKSCFTDQGWAGFNTALEKSGNLEAIKTQKLTVSSQVDGKPQFIEAKDNQWKITLPLQVVYQNDKEKVTQLLNVNLTVGRKITGDLGILQMIATPRSTNPALTTGTSNPSDSTSSPSNNAAPTAPANTGIAPPAPTVNPSPEQNSPTGPSTNNPSLPH